MRGRTTEPPLLPILRRIIVEQGPLSIAAYMTLALGHPRHGYYTSRDPLGARGDFITAPEISQLFGESLAVWAALMWEAMGRPAPVSIVELGPGRGTLMADLTRTLGRIAPELAAAAETHLIETSPILRAKQQALLSTPSSRPERVQSVAKDSRSGGIAAQRAAHPSA
ncbi:MAG: SAM-dependent methyltransferase, partial [Alphaproteobacteria bacterium]